MRYIFHVIFLIILCSNSFGQKIKVISQGLEPDSSFYHIAKINDNEFWAGGEYGILKKIDSLGQVSTLNYPNEGLNILTIIESAGYIFVVTDNAVIYRYNPKTEKFLKKTFDNFDNRCFYDVIALKNGKLMACGGTSGISTGEKKVPNGFIATFDVNFEQVEVVWSTKWKFVWSLLELENGHIIAATFNGLNTRIISTENGIDWKKDAKIKGLVHELAFLDNNIWYSGTKSLRYTKHGIMGKVELNHKQVCLNDIGCLWSMDVINGKVISATTTSKLSLLDKATGELAELDVPSSFYFYDMEKISESKILVVGHGKSIYMIDFSAVN